jgi:hypothetical protein
MPIEAGSGGELTIKVRHRDSKHPCAREPEPEAVFSDEQWAAIAQLIERSEIPLKAKKDICLALFEYTLAIIKPEDLNRFVEEVRQFGVTASRIQNFLRNFRWIERIQDLIEEIHQTRRFLDREFARRPNPKGARPKSIARDTLVYHLGLVYMELTGEVPGRTVNSVTGKLTGTFPDFTAKIFEFHGIKPAGLKDAIGKARQALMPKNP